jgi:hypothetical protein
MASLSDFREPSTASLFAKASAVPENSWHLGGPDEVDQERSHAVNTTATTTRRATRRIGAWIPAINCD